MRSSHLVEAEAFCEVLHLMDLQVSCCDTFKNIFNIRCCRYFRIRYNSEYFFSPPNSGHYLSHVDSKYCQIYGCGRMTHPHRGHRRVQRPSLKCTMPLCFKGCAYSIAGFRLPPAGGVYYAIIIPASSKKATLHSSPN